MAIKVTRDMLQREYSWKMVDGDDPRAIRIDAHLFNRREGYEVVPMIQKIVDHFGYEDEADVHRIEAVIADDLPGNVRGRDNVIDWLIHHLEV